MFRADVAMRQALSLLGSIGEDALAFVAERKIDRSRDFFADGGVSLDLLADGLDRAWDRRKRFVRALSSRRSPRSRCSVSM